MSLLPLALAFCQPDETISGHSDPTLVWQLAELNRERIDVTATLRFPEKGRVIGEGPCNAFTATQTAPYPWIEIVQLVSTRRACPDLPLETAFFAALQSATLVEASDEILILTDEAGRETVFRASP
nr:META domain-containing protein [Jannaschia aquimarina]